MKSIQEAIGLLGRIEGLEPFNERPKSLKGFQSRTILLLLSIMETEGESQAYYKDKYGWTYSSTGGHTKVLLENGFIIQGDDERDPRGQSKRLYPAEGVREYVNNTLGLIGD